MALDVGGLVDVPVVAHVAPVDPAHGHDLTGAEDLALRGHARTTTRGPRPRIRALTAGLSWAASRHVRGRP